jgi:hypothetical protein
MRRFHHQTAGRLGLGILEELGPQIIFAHVMIEDGLVGLRGANDIGHRPQLLPGTRVQNDQHLGIGKLGRRNIDA